MGGMESQVKAAVGMKRQSECVRGQCLSALFKLGGGLHCVDTGSTVSSVHMLCRVT